MRAVVQRVRYASVYIEEELHAHIGPGALVLLGVHKDDCEADHRWLSKKVAGARIFEDRAGLMNRDISDAGGEFLVVSQFTLLASSKRGNRPSFNDAAPPEKGRADYESFCKELATASGRTVKTGVFAADMKVKLLNDGPVTLLYDTRNKE